MLLLANGQNFTQNVYDKLQNSIYDLQGSGKMCNCLFQLRRSMSFNVGHLVKANEIINNRIF
jgi:hypothetical protein